MDLRAVLRDFGYYERDLVDVGIVNQWRPQLVCKMGSLLGQCIVVTFESRRV